MMRWHSTEKAWNTDVILDSYRMDVLTCPTTAYNPSLNTYLHRWPCPVQAPATPMLL